MMSEVQNGPREDMNRDFNELCTYCGIFGKENRETARYIAEQVKFLLIEKGLTYSDSLKMIDVCKSFIEYERDNIKV